MPEADATISLDGETGQAKACPTRAGRNWRSILGFQLLILAIVTGFYWKLTLTKQFLWIGSGDLAQQVLPWFEEQTRQVQHHQIPLWDPHFWLGAPLLGQAQPGTAYPLNWLLFLVPESHGHIRIDTLQWYFIAIHYIAALFCFLLCRDLGCSRAASLIAGLTFSLAGYVGTTDWPQMVNGAVWFPLVLLFLLRSVRGVRPLSSAAVAGTCLGMAWLAGHHQIPIFTTLTAAGVWLYYICRQGKINWSLLRLAAVMGIFMALVGALQILPAVEYGHLAQRWVSGPRPIHWDEPVPYSVHQNFSLTNMALFAILFPGLSRHADPFMGVVASGLILLGVALCWKQHVVKLFAAISIGGLVYALGQSSVYQGFLYSIVPTLDKARVPSMAVVLFSLGGAVLAAFGFDHFIQHGNSAWARRIVTGLLAFGLLTFSLLMGALFMKKLGWDADDRVALTAFVTVLLAALLYAWRAGNLTGRQAAVLLVMLLLLELGNNSGYAFVDRSDAARMVDLEKVWSNRDVSDFLHQQPGPFRVETTTEAISPNWSEYHDLDAVLSNGASASNNVVDNTEWHTVGARLLFGVRYTLGDKPPFPDSIERFTGASGIKVYENPGAFPRAWAVHEMIPIRTAVDGARIIGSQQANLHSKAFSLEEIPALTNCGTPDEVSVLNYRPAHVTIRANMACQGLVILSDAFFPGWSAKVDSNPARIFEVDGALRGVLVPQGTHQVAFHYRPKSVYLGAALTLLGLVGAVALSVGARRNARLRPAETI